MGTFINGGGTTSLFEFTKSIVFLNSSCCWSKYVSLISFVSKIKESIFEDNAFSCEVVFLTNSLFWLELSKSLIFLKFDSFTISLSKLKMLSSFLTSSKVLNNDPNP